MLKHERENLLSFTSDVNDSNTQESLFKKSAEGVSGHGYSYMPQVSQAKGWRNKEMFAQIDKIITAIDNAVWGPVSYTHLDVYKRQALDRYVVVYEIL